MLIALSLVIVLSGPSSAGAKAFVNETPARTAFDGAWWMARSGDQREAFVEGRFDCLLTDTPGPHPDGDPDLLTYAPAITALYKTGRFPLKTDVLEVMRWADAHDQAGFRREGVIGVFYPERHGLFDGARYYQLDAPVFVAGYLACRATYLHETPKASIASDVARLDRAYGIHPVEDKLGSRPVDIPRSWTRWHQKTGDLLAGMLAAEAGAGTP